jgi:acyl dehydratase
VNKRYFEDLAVGQKFASSTLGVDADAITAFAAQFDPQPFHLDDEAARHTIFEGLAASGWHTAALTMRLCVASDFRPAGGIVGIGGELNWLKPVRPGDALRVEIEIIETRLSRSRPAQGIVKIRLTTLNQDDEPVQIFTPTLFVDRRVDPRAG